MLTIEEIKKELDAGNTVELECIDKHGLKKEHYGYGLLLRLDRFIVSNLNGEDIFFNDSLVGLSENHLKHFRIKRPAPTFNDLIDVATKAKKDGVLKYLRITDDAVIINTTNRKSLRTSYDIPLKPHQYGDYAKYIQSLYTETFTINKSEDLKRINIDVNPVLTTSSGESYKILAIGFFDNIKEPYLTLLFNEDQDYSLATLFIFLKGATVTQSRGEK